MTWEEAHRRCPGGVVPACHNSLDNVTVSGPAESVTTFVSQLQKEGVFAKAVQTGGIAFHSHYMSQTAPALKQRLQQVYFPLVLRMISYIPDRCLVLVSKQVKLRLIGRCSACRYV